MRFKKEGAPCRGQTTLSCCMLFVINRIQQAQWPAINRTPLGRTVLLTCPAIRRTLLTVLGGDHETRGSS